MINKNRVFGQNVYYNMMNKNSNVLYWAERLGFSEQDLRRIFDARLFLDTKEKEEIARALGVSMENLFDDNMEIPHDERSLIEYRGAFSKKENKEKILDLFDMYCDIQELLIRERLKPSL